MILKASQRGGGAQLAAHLLRTDENDHVEVHDVRNFVCDDVRGAFREACAISRGSKCVQYLFSLSLNPPKDAHVPIAVFEDAIARVEKRFGLERNARVIVFHEKEGRRHAHCVWSRIDPQTMKAVNMAHFKRRLVELARQLYIENGWRMPRGLINEQERNPLNFSREEWQQAKRIKRDPKSIKRIFQECWEASDSMPGFRGALEARGYFLAQGDRRGYVAVDWKGEIYAIARWTGIRTKEVRERLGEPDKLLTVEVVSDRIKALTEARLRQFSDEMRNEFEGAQDRLVFMRSRLVEQQRTERADLQYRQAARWAAESRVRAERFRKGLRGLWDRITGRHRELARANEKQVEEARQRDQIERENLIAQHLEDRRHLQRQMEVVRKNHDRQLAEMQSGEADGSPSRQRDLKKRNQYRMERPSLRI